MLKFKKTKYISLDTYSEERSSNNHLEGESHPVSSRQENQKVNKNIDLEKESVEKSPSVPDGAWIKCNDCGETLYSEDVRINNHCCPKCNAHFRINASKRLHILTDESTFIEWDRHMTSKNVLEFPDYDDKLKTLQLKTGLLEAVITGQGKINGHSVVLAFMDSGFLMGSMGQIVGEKITRAVERATKNKLPIIIFSTSGGARMQEGIVSLMQMAKTSAALKRHSEAGLLYISVLTDPTTGGVTASYAMLGDINISEPGALIGFAGPRVIEQTIGQKLPEGFQRAEFLLEKGFIDLIINRNDLKNELGKILALHGM